MGPTPAITRAGAVVVALDWALFGSTQVGVDEILATRLACGILAARTCRVSPLWHSFVDSVPCHAPEDDELQRAKRASKRAAHGVSRALKAESTKAPGGAAEGPAREAVTTCSPRRKPWVRSQRSSPAPVPDFSLDR